jgi:hypothetical protein
MEIPPQRISERLDEREMALEREEAGAEARMQRDLDEARERQRQAQVFNLPDQYISGADMTLPDQYIPGADMTLPDQYIPARRPVTKRRVSSDEDMKEHMEYGEGKKRSSGVTESKATEMVRKTPGYSYEYKDEYEGQPGTKRGRQYGIMAQDLEKTEAGRSLVDLDENGMKHVDTDRLSMVNTAALNDLTARLDAIEKGKNRSTKRRARA